MCVGWAVHVINYHTYIFIHSYAMLFYACKYIYHTLAAHRKANTDLNEKVNQTTQQRQPRAETVVVSHFPFLSLFRLSLCASVSMWGYRQNVALSPKRPLGLFSPPSAFNSCHAFILPLHTPSLASPFSNPPFPLLPLSSIRVGVRMSQLVRFKPRWFCL